MPRARSARATVDGMLLARARPLEAEDPRPRPAPLGTAAKSSMQCLVQCGGSRPRPSAPRSGSASM
eukprot:5063709-Alexandrium_andersonii.AAC.1